MKKLEKGFTLIELMIVVAIIAILAAVAAPKFGQQLVKAKNAKGVQVIGTWKSANTLYYSDNNEYAPAATGFGSATTGLGKYVDSGTIAKTTIASATSATVKVGYASAGGTSKDTVTLTYALSGSNEGTISVTGGAMKDGSTDPKDDWSNQ